MVQVTPALVVTKETVRIRVLATTGVAELPAATAARALVATIPSRHPRQSSLNPQILLVTTVLVGSLALALALARDQALVLVLIVVLLVLEVELAVVLEQALVLELELLQLHHHRLPAVTKIPQNQFLGE